MPVVTLYRLTSTSCQNSLPNLVFLLESLALTIIFIYIYIVYLSAVVINLCNSFNKYVLFLSQSYDLQISEKTIFPLSYTHATYSVIYQISYALANTQDIYLLSINGQSLYIV